MEQIISINASAFIIPNSASRLDGIYNESTKDYLCKMAAMNNIELTDDDKIIQIWLHNEEELNTDNIARHGFMLKLNDEGMGADVTPYELENIPAKLLENVKEGGVITYKAPYHRKIKDPSNFEAEDLEIIFNINMTCQQKGYRYGSFGNFEDVVSKVIK